MEKKYQKIDRALMQRASRDKRTQRSSVLGNEMN